MPHGRLTPLGRQLRTVLLQLHSPRQLAPTASKAHPCHDPQRCLSGSTSFQTVGAAAVTIDGVQEDAPSQQDERSIDPTSRCRGADDDSNSSNALPRTLPDAARSSATAHPRRSRVQRKWERTSPLMPIIGRYIKHRKRVGSTAEAQLDQPFTLTPAQHDQLTQYQPDVKNIRDWADIVAAKDSYEAASLIAKKTEEDGLHSVPRVVLDHVLRKPYVKPEALSIYLTHCDLHIPKADSQESAYWSMPTLFVVYGRLVAHCRRVWPRAMVWATDSFVNNVQGMERLRPAVTGQQLSILTSRVNHMLWVISRLTAERPFKNIVFQEKAMVRILRFMAEHDPPLHVNRKGYRAVICIQLAQKKTGPERQWADLKALSWPPWKEDRTAVDADVSAEEHGLSQASRALRAMRTAGYAPTEWEEIASIYAGWDTDGTPTIQTLVQLGLDERHSISASTAWVARITSTRTVQEAWACYLAYEDECNAQNEDVYLAIFRKLNGEVLRTRKLLGKPPANADTYTVFPGDTKEVWPLPPSTHLYTYTRTTPPTVEEFYAHLRSTGVVLGGPCLAFLVANAQSLSAGVRYLLDSQTMNRSVKDSPLSPCRLNIDRVSKPVFVSAVQLFSKFSMKALPHNFPKVYLSSNPITPQPQMIGTERLDPEHLLMQVIELLRRRQGTIRPAWNAVLRALTLEPNIQNIYSIFLEDISRPRQVFPPKHEFWRGAIIAHVLACGVKDKMEMCHLNLDHTGFHALCQSSENATIACWKILRHEDSLPKAETDVAPVRDALSFLLNQDYVTRLKADFRVSVGDSRSGHITSENSATTVPRLLNAPDPALLHAYIRALGWTADYDGLLDMVRWMVKHQVELSERAARDRNGRVVTRRSIIALRVFLEREFVGREIESSGSERLDRLRSEDESGAEEQLGRLEVSAPASIQDEIRDLIESQEYWCGWPTDEEVEQYSSNEKMQGF